jgi:hypothetical protein
MQTTEFSRKQLRAAFDMTTSVVEAIRKAGEIPAGILYAALCSHLSKRAFDAMIDQILATGLVSRDKQHLLKWIGPEIPS